jgi:quinol monooxygenase YgiN
MQYVLIIHRVRNYLAWKRVFDQTASTRVRAGEFSYQLLRNRDDPARIFHFARWRSLAAARRFFESSEVAAIRQDTGAEAPEFVYLTELESGSLLTESVE